MSKRLFEVPIAVVIEYVIKADSAEEARDKGEQLALSLANKQKSIQNLDIMGEDLSGSVMEIGD